MGQIVDILSMIVSIIAITISIFTYFHGLNRERRTDTLKSFEEIRKKYYNTVNLNEPKKIEYLNELEFFATGVNEKIYDIRIVEKMSGSRLINQYEKWAAELIQDRKAKYGNSKSYCEYEKMIKSLKYKKERRKFNI